MDANICVNQVFDDKRSDKQFRLLWIDPERADCFVFWLFQKSGMPERATVKEIEEGLLNGWIIEAEDPFVRTKDPTKEETDRRDRLWEEMKEALLDEPGIFDKKVRSEHLKRIESGGGEKVPNLYRHLCRYWERGKTPDAFLPGFRSRADKGRRRLGYSRTQTTKPKEYGKPIMPEDLANFEAAIRKYYLTKEKKDLPDVYEKLIEDSYSVVERDEDGKEAVRVLPRGEIPTLRQFRYWYESRRDIREEAVRRAGETAFNLSGRARTGKCDHGVMGPGAQYQVDATVGDIYLVSQFDRHDIIGRPVIYFVMDTFSRMVTGMHIGLEGPSWTGMMMALYNAATDKVDYCHRFGIEITKEMWPCQHIPSVLLGDRGELESHKADTMVTMLGVRVENAPPYRGDLKPIIESHFKTVNDTVKPFLPGWVRPDDRQRGGRDYRLDARLDIIQFTRVIITCVIYYNTQHYLSGFEKNAQMMKDQVKAIPVKLWEWGIQNCSGALRTFPEKTVRLALMPKGNGSVTEKGISFKKLFYTCPAASQESWFENARKKGRYSVQVSYDPRDMDRIYVWDREGSDVHECVLLDWEQRYSGKSLDEVSYEQDKEDIRKADGKREELEAAINMNRTIEGIVAEANKMMPSTAGMTKAERLSGMQEARQTEKEAIRGKEAFTSAGTDGAPVAQAGTKAEGSASMGGLLTEEEWEKLDPIRRMLWEDLIKGRETDAGSEEEG